MRSSRASAAAHASESAPDLSTQASPNGRAGSQIAPVAGPSSTLNRHSPQVPAQPIAPQQNQGLPPPPQSTYPQDLFNSQSPAYPTLPTQSTPSAQHDAYARMFGGDSYPSSQHPEGYHIPVTPPHVQPHVPLGYNWQPTPISSPDNNYQPPYPYPLLVASQNVDSTFHHSPAHSQVYVYGSTFPTSPPSMYHYRPASPALSHAHSQFSASSQSQSSSESDSPAPGPVSIRTPFFSPEPLSVLLPTDGDSKFEAASLDIIREQESTNDTEVGLVPLDSLKRFHPYRRDPLDDRVVRPSARDREKWCWCFALYS
ncbi:hypothetical protein B0F90DRAFT_1053870 [Multifurca ochricompacta]|uniref:Uncharacterized protein n=1 Tax=Multifurca ochricompacta TaxID=376703 RepID=A0AAD4M7R9_9AGAM|nr:hypothetical protein B0F90DRAFT_1053870 [Multifurca ochricompacta]